MSQPGSILRPILIHLGLLCLNAVAMAQTNKTTPMPSAADLQKARTAIEGIDKQFSKDFYNGDSIALAAYYTKDAKFGSLTGSAIRSAWGSMIRNAIKDSTRNLVFTTTAFTGDGEFMIELGIYEMKDDNNVLKDKGKYLVVWKQEDGRWKLYRDLGL